MLSLHVVLYQPEIPANTGNIARTCAGTGTTLHLIRPLGFSTDDKMLKRAGLDYWKHVNIVYYDSLEEFLKKMRTARFTTLRRLAKSRLRISTSAIRTKIYISCSAGKPRGCRMT